MKSDFITRLNSRPIVWCESSDIRCHESYMRQSNYELYSRSIYMMTWSVRWYDLVVDQIRSHNMIWTLVVSWSDQFVFRLSKSGVTIYKWTEMSTELRPPNTGKTKSHNIGYRKITFLSLLVVVTGIQWSKLVLRHSTVHRNTCTNWVWQPSRFSKSDSILE